MSVCDACKGLEDQLGIAGPHARLREVAPGPASGSIPRRLPHSDLQFYRCTAEGCDAQFARHLATRWILSRKAVPA